MAEKLPSRVYVVIPRDVPKLAESVVRYVPVTSLRHSFMYSGSTVVSASTWRRFTKSGIISADNTQIANVVKVLGVFISKHPIMITKNRTSRYINEIG